MMKTLTRLFVLLMVLATSLLAAIYGTGAAYRSFLTPRSSHGSFSGVYGDSWLVDGATATFYDLAPRGNWLDVQAGDWHPEERPVPNVTVSVCGDVASTFDAVKGSVTRVFLTGDCEPRELVFSIRNPFQASPDDQRELGMQLHSMKVSSQAGVPLVSFSKILSVAALLFAGGLLLWYWLRFSPAIWLTPLAPLLGGYLVSCSEHLDYTNAIALWICLLSLLLGRIVGSDLYRKGRILKQGVVRPDRGSEETGETWTGYFPLFFLMSVLLLAAMLRFYGIDFGLPANYHPDEVPKYNAIMRMRAHGDLNPRYFLHPTMLLYATYFSNEVCRFFGLVQGQWEETLILSGRMMSALAGVGSVFFTYLIGRRLYSVWIGLFASLFLAVMPLHVTCSRYVKEDSLLTFVILCAVYAVIRGVQDNTIRWYLLGAILAGVSASVKYSGLLSIMFILGAPWLRSGTLVPDKRFFWWMIAAVIVMPLGFLMVSPYVLLDYQTFIRDFSHEQAHMARGHTAGISAWSQYWMYHIARSINPGIGLPGTIVALGGVGYLLYRRRMKDLFLVCLFLLFYLPAEYVKAKPAPQPERYIVPCLPFLAILAGIFLKRLSENKIRHVSPALVVFVLLVPLLRTVDLAGEIKHDTREQLAGWMKEHLPRGKTVAVDWKPYTVRFFDDEFTMAYLPRAEIIPSLDIDALREQNYDYLVLSSLFYRRYFKQPNTNPALREQIRMVFRRLPILAQFESTHGTYGFHNPRLTLFSLNEQDVLAYQQELKLKEDGKLAHTSNEMKASFNWKE